MKVRMTIAQLMEAYGGMKAAFLVNPNIATSTRNYVSPPGKTPLLVVMHEGIYRVGVLKSSNLLRMELLLWNLSHSQLLKREHWHHPHSWDTVTFPSNVNFMDGGYVNQVYSIAGSMIGVDHEPPTCSDFICLSGGPDYCPVPVCQKSIAIYCKIPGKAEHRKKHLRTVHINEKHLVTVPLHRREDMENNECLPHLKKICKQKDFANEKDFHGTIQRAAKAKPYTMLVPSLHLPTRIIVVSPSDFHTLEKQDELNIYCSKTTAAKPIVIREEYAPMEDDKDSVGVCVASINFDDESLAQSTEDITFASASTFHAALGRKGQTRSCAEHAGLAAYRNASRGTSKPNPTPAVADDDVRFQSYFDRSSQTNLISLFEVEKRLKELDRRVRIFGRKLLPALFSIPEEEQSGRALVTCGAPWRKGTCSFLSFVNGTHIDVNDLIDEELFEQIEYFSDYPHQLRRMKESVGFGAATTCQYKHLWNDGYDRESYKVVAYFMHHGVGVAHPLLDSSGFCFLGFASKHSTSLCYLVELRTNETILHNRKDRDIFMMFAWGSGGKSRVRRRRFHDLGGEAPRVTQTLMDDWIANHLEPTHQAMWDAMSEEEQNAYRTGEHTDENNGEELQFLPQHVSQQQNQEAIPTNSKDPAVVGI
ncbi:unnamed protein product [Cylindrotheca closterium]|uniref:Uncharacterized protein n=1 Tax=Cylindrotheca closterium TaxID=2856 RepID=A0AAD2JNB0_9STRA|nr:unnamed protein product [Cylindrotheca closterium]